MPVTLFYRKRCRSGLSGSNIAAQASRMRDIYFCARSWLRPLAARVNYGRKRRCRRADLADTRHAGYLPPSVALPGVKRHVCQCRLRRQMKGDGFIIIAPFDILRAARIVCLFRCRSNNWQVQPYRRRIRFRRPISPLLASVVISGR